MFFLCLDIYQLYFNCKFVRLSHSFIKGYLILILMKNYRKKLWDLNRGHTRTCWSIPLSNYRLQ